MTTVAATSVDPLAPATLGAHATTLLQRAAGRASGSPTTSESASAG
jgi:hypothetical protein